MTPDLVARLLGKETIKRELGSLRSFASQASHNCPELNEEDFFELVAINYFKGVRTEVSKIFGPAKAAKMLDPFNGKSREA